MPCRTIRIILSDIIGVAQETYDLVDNNGYYVFSGLSYSTLLNGVTFSIDSTSYNFTLTNYRQSGTWSGCNPNPNVSEVNIIFGSLVNWQENPSRSWRPIATGANGSGKSTQYLPASTDGYIQSDITDTAGTVNNFNTGMGFALSNALSPDYVYDYLVYVEGANGHYKTFDSINGYLDTGFTASTGDKMKTERIGNTLYAKYNRGGNWTTVYTFPNTTTANLYIYGGSSDIGVIEYVVNPVGYNII